MNTPLLPIERDAIELLLRGDSEVLDFLKRQSKLITAASRTQNSAGGYTELKLDHSPTQVVTPGFQLGGVELRSADGPRGGIGFMLSVSLGWLHQLEYFTYEDELPPLERLRYTPVEFVFSDREESLRQLARSRLETYHG